MADDLRTLVGPDAPPAAPQAPPPDPQHVLIAVALAASVEAASQARGVVRDLLHQGQRPDMADTACLLTSELVTNALVHSGAPVELVVDLDKARLAIEVIDASAEAPAPRDAEDMDTNGRGLAMVEHLADSWGVIPVRPGKSVWFALTA